MDVENIRSNTLYVKLLTLKENVGGYIIYVFEIINGIEPYYKYIMCTRFPNWDSPFIKIGDIGYLKYKEVEAGKDKWFDSQNNLYIPYKYSGIHFLDFIYENKNKLDTLTL